MAKPSAEWLQKLQGKTLGERYRLQSVLGIGGMGAVFDAVHVGVGRRVAVKILLPSALVDPVNIERFQQEARAAASVGRKGVVEILDFSEDPVCGPYLVMEFLQGISLQKRIEEGPLPIGEAVRIVVALLDTLAVVHARGIVHRDLKPANVFLAIDEDGREVIKILDFGISRMPNPDRETPLTEPGTVLGTARYMAPEQAISSDEVDPRTDLYSVGAILYTCVAGTHPFRNAGALTIVGALRSGSVPSLRAVAPKVPEAFAALVDRAMAPNREERFPDARSMAAALLPFLSLRETATAEAPKMIAPVAVPSNATVAPLQTAPVRPSRRWWIYALGALLVCLPAGVLAVFLLGDSPEEQAPDVGTLALRTSPAPTQNVAAPGSAVVSVDVLTNTADVIDAEDPLARAVDAMRIARTATRIQEARQHAEEVLRMVERVPSLRGTREGALAQEAALLLAGILAEEFSLPEVYENPRQYSAAYTRLTERREAASAFLRRARDLVVTPEQTGCVEVSQGFVLERFAVAHDRTQFPSTSLGQAQRATNRSVREATLTGAAASYQMAVQNGVSGTCQNAAHTGLARVQMLQSRPPN